MLEDSFSHDEVWPQPYNPLYVLLRSGGSVGKDPDVDIDAEPALQFDTEPGVEPEEQEPLPTDEASAEDSHEPTARLDDAGNEIPRQSTDPDEVDMDRPFQVTFGQRTSVCPDADGVDPLSTPPRGYTAPNILTQGWPVYALPLERQRHAPSSTVTLLMQGFDFDSTVGSCITRRPTHQAHLRDCHPKLYGTTPTPRCKAVLWRR